MVLKGEQEDIVRIEGPNTCHLLNNYHLESSFKSNSVTSKITCVCVSSGVMNHLRSTIEGHFCMQLTNFVFCECHAVASNWRLEEIVTTTVMDFIFLFFESLGYQNAFECSLNTGRIWMSWTELSWKVNQNFKKVVVWIERENYKFRGGKHSKTLALRQVANKNGIWGVNLSQGSLQPVFCP